MSRTIAVVEGLARNTLRVATGLSEAFPPLKSVVGCLGVIVDLADVRPSTILVVTPWD